MEALPNECGRVWLATSLDAAEILEGHTSCLPRLRQAWWEDTRLPKGRDTGGSQRRQRGCKVWKRRIYGSEDRRRNGTWNKQKISLMPSTHSIIFRGSFLFHLAFSELTHVHVIFDDLGRNKSLFKANLCITYWIHYRFSSTLMKSLRGWLKKKQLAS